ncbi:MAG: transcriptional regulator MntR [Limnochordia bacterium]|jgi:Mn-dependent DtxR family transcriptional regulator
MLTESMEDYLEMMYRLENEKGYIRVVDLAHCLKVKPSSVTRMIQKLDEAGFLTYEKYRNIALNEAGRRVGRFLVWRDQVLKDFLRILNAPVGVDEQVEGIEHYITPPTMGLIRSLLTYFRDSPHRLRELRKIQNLPSYPDGECLDSLRCWLFRHERDE